MGFCWEQGKSYLKLTHEFKRKKGGGRIVWLNHINYVGPLVQLGIVGVSMSVFAFVVGEELGGATVLLV